jgi:hypothetical protein
MEQVNLGSVIEQAITRSSQNRLGEKPPVFVALAPVCRKFRGEMRRCAAFFNLFCTSLY